MCGGINTCSVCKSEKKRHCGDTTLKFWFEIDGKEIHICSDCVYKKLNNYKGELFEQLIDGGKIEMEEVVEFYADEDRFDEFQRLMEAEYIRMKYQNSYGEIDEVIENRIVFDYHNNDISYHELFRIMVVQNDYECFGIVRALCGKKRDTGLFKFVCVMNWSRCIEYMIEKYDLTTFCFGDKLMDTKIREYRDKKKSLSKI